MAVETGQVEAKSKQNITPARVTALKTAFALENVDNTSDVNKPISTATQNALDDKQDILAEGAFIDGDKIKLDGIEALAEVNPTAGEIKSEYESNANTNAFTDAEQSKLQGIEANAEVNTVTPANKNIGIATENLTVTGTFNIDFSANDSMRLNLTGNTTLALTNTPASNETKVINLAITTTGGTETLTLPGTWNVYGTFDASVRNKISIEVANFTSGVEVDCFINQPN